MSGANQSWNRAGFWLVGLTAFWLTIAGVGQEVPEEKLQQLLRLYTPGCEQVTEKFWVLVPLAERDQCRRSLYIFPTRR